MVRSSTAWPELPFILLVVFFVLFFEALCRGRLGVNGGLVKALSSPNHRKYVLSCSLAVIYCNVIMGEFVWDTN